MSSDTEDTQKPWRFVTNHTQVLLAIAQNPDIRARDIADAVGITERAAQRIVADLVEAGYIESARVGRRNHYTINRTAPCATPRSTIRRSARSSTCSSSTSRRVGAHPR